MAKEVQKVETQLPAEQDEYLALMDQYAERGISFRPEDQLLPLIYILQSGSPIVEKRSESYIPGAEPGHFWLRNAIQPIRSGEEGISAIPVDMKETWVEWLPNRGGFVARHEAPPIDMMTKMIRGDDGRERSALVRRDSGNIISDTRELYIIVDGDPYVLPCTSTKHTFARQWQTMWHRFKHPKTGRIMPAFSRKYKLTTIPASNAIGKWFAIKFQDVGETTIPEIKLGISFSDALMTGAKKPEAPVSMAEGSKGEDIPF